MAAWERGIPRTRRDVPNRVDRLRVLGNAVVPQVAQYVGELIMREEHARGATLANPL